MKKKSSGHKNRIGLTAEEAEDILTMSEEDIPMNREEIVREGRKSQAEALARSFLKLTLAERSEALKKLKKTNITLFETVEYLLENFMVK